jgi:hypothetical protein
MPSTNGYWDAGGTGWSVQVTSTGLTGFRKRGPCGPSLMSTGVHCVDGQKE